MATVIFGLAKVFHSCQSVRMEKLSSWLSDQGKASSVFAREIGVSVSTMHALLHGRNIPSLPVAFRIEDATNGAVPARAWVTNPAAVR